MNTKESNADKALAAEKVKNALDVLNKAIEEAKQLKLTVGVNLNRPQIGEFGPLITISIYERLEY